MAYKLLVNGLATPWVGFEGKLARFVYFEDQKIWEAPREYRGTNNGQSLNLSRNNEHILSMGTALNSTEIIDGRLKIPDETPRAWYSIIFNYVISGGASPTHGIRAYQNGSRISQFNGSGTGSFRSNQLGPYSLSPGDLIEIRMYGDGLLWNYPRPSAIGVSLIPVSYV